MKQTRVLLLTCALGALALVSSSPAQSTYEPYFFGTLAGVAPGSVDGAGSAARFRTPTGVAVDNAGNVYVADQQNQTIRKTTPAGVVSTLAGLAGSRGSSDGSGGAARFSDPFGVSVDGAGNVYVADSSNHTVRKITPAGAVSTLAGLAGSAGSADGAGSTARFSSPTGVAVDTAGNVYVADYGNQTIRRITPAGVVSTVAGLAGSAGSVDGNGSAARFRNPLGLAVDSSATLYVGDFGNGTIRKITAGGDVSTFAGLAGSFGSADGTGSAARFNSAAGVAVDSAGNIYVADSSNHTIRKISPGAVVTTLAGLAGNIGRTDGTGGAARFNTPYGVAVDSGGNVYVADAGSSTLRKITPAAVVSTLAGLAASAGSADGTGSAAQFFVPAGIAGDSNGNLYVADSGNHTIRKIAPGGVVSTLAGLPGSSGSVDGTGSAARFSLPIAVAVDSAGNVYVADSGNQTIRKITSAGAVSTLAGLAGNVGFADGIGSAARFNTPSGVTVDSAGNVYVADASNHAIRRITAAAAVSTVAGLPGSPGSADGTGNGARFNNPNGVAVDGAGNIYVADTSNHTIRKITPGAVVSTLAGLAGNFGSADGTGNAARFHTPYSVAVDAAGNVFVANTGNSTIRKITSAGAVTTLAGSPGVVGSADGSGSAASFNFPRGIAVDGTGALFVADSYNHTIRTSENVFALLGGVSRRLHGGSGSFDITLNSIASPPAIECRSGGANGDHMLVFTFSRQITSGNAVVSSGTGTVAGTPSVLANQLFVSLTGVGNAQTITITLSGVTDTVGQVLPNTNARLGFLRGDVTGSGTVNASDVGQVKSLSGLPATAQNFRADVIVSGTINATDVGQVKALAGTFLPPPPPNKIAAARSFGAK